MKSSCIIFFLALCWAQPVLADGARDEVAQFFESDHGNLKAEYRNCKADANCTITDGTGCEEYRAVNTKSQKAADAMIRHLNATEKCTVSRKIIPTVHCFQGLCKISPTDPM